MVLVPGRRTGKLGGRCELRSAARRDAEQAPGSAACRRWQSLIRRRSAWARRSDAPGHRPHSTRLCSVAGGRGAADLAAEAREWRRLRPVRLAGRPTLWPEVGWAMTRSVAKADVQADKDPQFRPGNLRARQPPVGTGLLRQAPPA